MYKLSQKQIILNYLKSALTSGENNGWVREYHLRSKNTPFGWIGFQGDRRVRELAQEGKLERRYCDGYAEFKYKPQPPQSFESREQEEAEIMKIATS